LASRDVIGQAKGILIERFGVDADKAFAMMVASSQDTNLKLHAVAEWLSTEVGVAAPHHPRLELLPDVEPRAAPAARPCSVHRGAAGLLISLERAALVLSHRGHVRAR